MKKLLLICLLSAAFSFGAFAQQGSIHLNVGAEGAFPIGDWSEGYNIGFGASGKGLYGVSDAGQAGLNLGWNRFGMKDDIDEDFSASISIVPVFAVYRHYFGGLYVEPQAGLSIVKSKITVSGTDMGSFSGSGSSTSFGYAAGLGYLMGDIDISARYQGFSESGMNGGFAALRVAYSFSLN